MLAGVGIFTTKDMKGLNRSVLVKIFSVSGLVIDQMWKRLHPACVCRNRLSTMRARALFICALVFILRVVDILVATKIVRIVVQFRFASSSVSPVHPNPRIRLRNMDCCAC